jgi:hypothetical protein
LHDNNYAQLSAKNYLNRIKEIQTRYTAKLQYFITVKKKFILQIQHIKSQISGKKCSYDLA